MKPRILHLDIINEDFPKNMFETHELSNISIDELQSLSDKELMTKVEKDMRSCLREEWITQYENDHGAWIDYDRKDCTALSLQMYMEQMVKYAQEKGVKRYT